MDEAGRLVSLADQDGHQWTFGYDRYGNLTTINGPGGARWNYEYAGEALIRVKGPSGDVRAKPKKDTLEMRASASTGMWQESVSDRYGRPVRSQAQGAKPVRFQYADDGRAFSVLSEGGTIRYQADEKELAVNVTFDL